MSIAEPLGIDQSLWASAVRGMERGQLLYRDVWEQRPPGIYWIYLAGFRTFGWTASAVAWLDILASAATTLLLFWITRRLSDALTGGLAAALYAALTMPAWLYGHGGFLERSVCETFIVVAVALSIWCSVRLRETGSVIYAAGVGLFAGAAVVLKPNAGLYFPAVLVWILVYSRQRNAAPSRSRVTHVLVAAAATAIIPAVALVWLWTLGTLQDARTAIVDFNRFYVAQGLTLSDYALAFSRAVWLRIKTEPLWLAGAVGAVISVWDLARTRWLPPLAGLAVAWGAAAALVIVANGARLFNSYFIQALPPLAILAAWLLTDAARESALRRMILAATIVLMIVLLVQRHYVARVLDTAGADLDVLCSRIDAATYLDRFGGYANSRGYSARANAELAAYVREHTQPDERIFLFGINGAGVYFAADRLTAHRFLRVNFFVATDFPDPRFRLDAVTAELSAARPRYLIFERLNSPSEMGRTVDVLERDPLVVRLLEPYRLETRIEDFTLYRRID